MLVRQDILIICIRHHILKDREPRYMCTRKTEDPELRKPRPAHARIFNNLITTHFQDKYAKYIHINPQLTTPRPPSNQFQTPPQPQPPLEPTMDSIRSSPLLPPVIALNAWTLVIEAWMYATRLPVLTRLRIVEKNHLTHEEINKHVPASVRWKADNFINLFEQPTQFYAVAIVLALAGGGKTDGKLAWAYVAARVAHSLVHCTNNNIMRRFSLYIVSSGLVAVMTGRAALLLAA
jgi:hypothetical protein